MDPKQLNVDLSYKLACFPSDLKNHVAIISGATRGIGRACALKLASLGCNVVVAAKSDTPQKTLPGTIYSVAEECRYVAKQHGFTKNSSFGFKIDMRDYNSLKACVDATAEKFGRIDIVINNASALWWQDIVDTPLNRFDMIFQINARGTFFLTQLCLPYLSLKFPDGFDKSKLSKTKTKPFGRVISMAPSIKSTGYGGYTAYNIAKLGMTMVALGVHEEYYLKGVDVAGIALWPATVIESYASINFEMGEKKQWRKADILADAVLAFVADGSSSGQMTLDDEFLLSQGLKIEDMVRYRCDPENEPPRLLAGNKDATLNYRRGSVTRLDQDKAKSSNSLHEKATSKL